MPFTTIYLDKIIMNHDCADKAQALANLTPILAKDLELDPDTLHRALTAQEKRSPSGMGNGVTIPHCRINGVKESYIAFVKYKHGIKKWATADGQPVHFSLFLISGMDDTATHLYQLSRLSRVMRNKNMCDLLKTADKAETIQALFLSPLERQIAA